MNRFPSLPVTFRVVAVVCTRGSSPSARAVVRGDWAAGAALDGVRRDRLGALA